MSSARRPEVVARAVVSSAGSSVTSALAPSPRVSSPCAVTYPARRTSIACRAGDRRDARGLVVARLPRSSEALRGEGAGLREHAIERVDRLDGSSHRRAHEADVVEDERVGDEVVGALELGEGAGVLAFVEEAE